MLRTAIIAAALLVTSVAAADAVDAADEQPAPKSASGFNDYLFPKSGDVSVKLATGVPFPAFGDVSVGIGDRFAIGLLIAGGPFPSNFLTGLYPRADVVHVGPLRLVLDAPLLWYPGINGADNWLIARPTGRIEGSVGRLRLYALAGALLGKMVGAAPVSGPIAPYGGGGLPSGIQHGDVWNTFGGGAAVALSSRTSVLAERFVLMDGFSIAGPEWFSSPAAVMLGVTTTL
jgi:hypothetical protein